LEQGGRQSSYRDISGESGDEGDYEHGEARSLEELWWHEELLWSADNHRRECKKSRKNEDGTTPTGGAANAGRGVPLELNGKPNVHVGIKPAAPPFPAELLTLPKQLVGLLAELVGSPAELAGWPDQLPGLVAPLAGQHSPSIPQLEERANRGRARFRHVAPHCESEEQFHDVQDNFDAAFTDSASNSDFENNIAELEDDLYASAKEDGGWRWISC
jgi:hypothetical protein